jgi:MSHA biogenesis protein MshQ
MKINANIIFIVLGLMSLSELASANVTVTTATGGGAIASNTATGCSAAGTWASLTGPTIKENNAGEIGSGSIVLSAPAGFEFNTNAVTILLTGNATNTNNINDVATGTVMAVTSITSTAITFNVTAISTRNNTLTWQGIQVRPTASTPLASGNITETGASTIAGMTGSTNLGTLTEVISVPACAAAPTVATNAATALTTTGATLNGTVSSNGASTIVTFDYGLTVSYGSTATAATSPLPATASNTAVSAAVTGLTCGSTYHFRVKGVNSLGTSNGSDLVFATSACPAPIVTSINTSSASPTKINTAVTWTVVFDTTVTGVDLTDFSLVQADGVTGATLSSVSGSGTTYTVTANTGTGTIGTLTLKLIDNDTIINAYSVPLGGVGAGNGNFTGQSYTVCSPPSNIPAGVSCQCDTFGRAALNPSTIFGANWIVSTSDATGILPSIVNSGYLRLTNNTGNNAKAVTVPGIFPAAGNYISVEFRQYAYNGTGADGIAVTLSDYAVPAVPGAYGGSLGYAQETGIHDGFAGGWLGVGLDEYGNYQNPTEGRLGGPLPLAGRHCHPGDQDR